MIAGLPPSSHQAWRSCARSARSNPGIDQHATPRRTALGVYDQQGVRAHMDGYSPRIALGLGILSTAFYVGWGSRSVTASRNASSGR